MKRLGMSLVMVLSVLYAARALDPSYSELREGAAKSYAEGQYAEAIRSYEAILELRTATTDIYYNLGNAYFKSGDYARSILNYERAARLRPSDPDIRHNLNVANARIRDRVEPIPLLFVVEWWNDLKEFNSMKTLFVWSVILLWLVGGSVYLFFASRSIALRRLVLIAGILLFLAFSASAVLVQDKREDLEARRYAIVLARETTAKSAPDASGIDSFTIHEGLKVEILQRSENHCQIRLADGKNGWVLCGAIEHI